MELFERIRYLSKKTDCSLARIAAHIGVTPQAFNKWLDVKSQRNIWEHLPKIIELFPEVRPEWLYMDQEPAFHDGTGPALPSDSVQELKAKLISVEAALEEERRLNRRLLERLLDEGKN